MTTGARCRRDQPLQHALQNILAPHDHLHINHERALPVPRGTEYSCRWTLTILGSFFPDHCLVQCPTSRARRQSWLISCRVRAGTDTSA